MMTEPAPAMMFASAVSRAGGADVALTEVVGELSRRLTGDADVVVVFATPDYSEALGHVGEALRGALGARVVVGCTAQGVVGMGRELEDGPGLSVLAGVLPGARVEAVRYDPLDYPAVIDTAPPPEVPPPPEVTASAEDASTASAAGSASPEAEATLREAMGLPASVSDLRCMVLMVDPFSTPLAGLLPAFNAALPGVPIVGGVVTGGARPGANRLLIDDRVYHDGAIGLAMSGQLAVHTTVSQGCRPIGRSWVITRAKRHIIQELGGRKAFDVLRHTVSRLDERDRELAQTTGLQVGRVINEYKRHQGRGDFLIRGIIGIDPEAGYFAIGDPRVRVGQTVQFHVRDARTARQDLAMLLDAQRLHGQGEGALLFTCSDRGTRLFEHRDTDATLIGEALGRMPMAGFFAGGEIGPIGGENYVHLQTASLVVFRAMGE